MNSVKTNVLVIGGGPGGYVTALRAGQLGLTTVLVEEAALGGPVQRRLYTLKIADPCRGHILPGTSA